MTRFTTCLSIVGLLVSTSLGQREAAKPPPAKPDAAAPLRVHIISGSKEYQSEPSLKEFKEHVAKHHNVTFTASWGQDQGTSLDNLKELESAELMLVFTRRMKLPEEQMKLIRKHWESGKPVVGIRTASHAFQQADNEVFDRKVLGGNHNSHYGDEPAKVTNVEAQAAHPVLRGVGPFTSRKLYHPGPLAKDVVVLQSGDNGQGTHPVTWVHTYSGGRTFYTSLGVPEDFKDDNFRRLLTNAIFWTTQRDPERMKKPQ
jgi:type 1 glutamine amidotransferase